MIKSVRLQNFFSFEDETIELHPEANVFVGTNGSGKSNILKAFKLLQEGMAGRLRQLILDQWGGFDAIRFKGSHGKEPILLTFEFDSLSIPMRDLAFDYNSFYQIAIRGVKNSSNFLLDEVLYTMKEGSPIRTIHYTFANGTVELESTSGKDSDNPPSYEGFDPQELALRTIGAFRESLISVSAQKVLQGLFVYDYFDTTPASKIRRPVIATSDKRISADGSNLPQILNTIKINDKDNYYHILNQLRNVNVNFTGIDFNLIGGNIELMLEEAKYKSSVHVTHVSDGTLRFLCLMAIFFNENRGGFICIDEPELGLHPDMIKAVFDAMMSSTGTTQYLITTHSDHLLDHFGLENIRVVEKDDNNSSKVKALDAKDFEGWYEVFSPGNMWRQGDFGGNRY